MDRGILGRMAVSKQGIATMLSVAFNFALQSSGFLNNRYVAALCWGITSVLSAWWIIKHQRERRGIQDEHDAIDLFYNEHDPNCYQTGGRILAPVVGDKDIEYNETIYRIGILSNKTVRACRLVLAGVEPQQHDPGQQRIGLPMQPRISDPGGTAEFTNKGAPPIVNVLQERKRRDNPMNEWAYIRLIYGTDTQGQAKWFENDDYILTFRLEGSMEPRTCRLEP